MAGAQLAEPLGLGCPVAPDERVAAQPLRSSVWSLENAAAMSFGVVSRHSPPCVTASTQTRTAAARPRREARVPRW
eukprot:4582762-Prymnesium_polylepis.2